MGEVCEGSNVEEFKKEILDTCVSVIFDGTMRNTEYTFVVRFVTSHKSEAWTISQRVAELRLVDGSVDGKQLAMLMTDVLIRQYQIPPSRIPFIMRDQYRLRQQLQRRQKFTDKRTPGLNRQAPTVCN